MIKKGKMLQTWEKKGGGVLTVIYLHLGWNWQKGTSAVENSQK